MNELRRQLESVAQAFTDSPEELTSTLRTLSDDVEQATNERLCLFPVTHHSPASALQMVQYLRSYEPKLVLIEACEDLRPLVEQLDQCSLPVALQSYASEPKELPRAWAPLNVLLPFTNFSAEFQAIAYAMETGAELRFVDRSTDLVHQWCDPQYNPDAPIYDDELTGAGQTHLEVGSIVPSFAAFHDLLLANARMSHFEEWSNLYIEEPSMDVSTLSYRQMMYFVGSLFRRMGTTEHNRNEIRSRDRYMWTRIKQALKETKISPEDAIFICGAAHTANDDVAEFGVDSTELFEIPEQTPTQYHYGLVPTSYASIERQFGHARGAVGLAEERWKKACAHQKVTPFAFNAKKKQKKKGASDKKATPQLSFDSLLIEPPALRAVDEEELVRWCTSIVAEVRKAKYLASTADAIAIYQTSILLARIRGRQRPSAYDFVDASETCLEKSRQPGKRSVRQCCEQALGANKEGSVGYDAAPPLLRDIYDRLQPINVTDKTKKVTRILMDFDAKPELRECSELLWRLRTLLPDTRVARPIMGKLELGHVARQESWDVCFGGPEQRSVIELAYEANQIEQVLEARLQERAFGDQATSLTAFDATEQSLILLSNQRLTQALGDQVVALLVKERDVASAPQLFRQARRLVYHFRSSGDPTPEWLENLVRCGFDHYCRLLPEGFGDKGTSPEQVAGVCGFLFVLESLALSLGCERSQVEIAIHQGAKLAVDPEKLGLLWACEWLVKIKSREEVRAAFLAILNHPIGRRAYPGYLSGLLQAIEFAPSATDLAVEQVGRAFAELSDDELYAWMPSLIGVLRNQDGGIAQFLREAKRELPRSLDRLDEWSPTWKRDSSHSEEVSSETNPFESNGESNIAPASERAVAVRQLLGGQRDSLVSHAALLGLDTSWREELAVESGKEGTSSPVTIVVDYPEAAAALHAVLQSGLTI